MRDIMDLHTHTIASGHAYSTLYEMARAASEHGLSIFGSTDHGPTIDGAPREIFFANFKVIPSELFGVRVLMGCELNILDYEGTIDLPERLLRKMDYAIASLHLPCCAPGTTSQNTAAILGAMKNPYVKIVGHPDDGRYPVDFDTIAAAAAERGVLLEVNNSSLDPRSSRVNSRENYEIMLERCAHYRTSIIINSDSHIEADVGKHAASHQLLEELDFPEDLIVNTSADKLLPYIPSLGGSGEHTAVRRPI